MNITQYMNNIIDAVNSSEIIANRLRSDHIGYLLNQLIPKFKECREKLTKTLEELEELTELKSDKIKAKIIIQMMNQLQDNFFKFKRFVSVFNVNRENSFIKQVNEIETNMMNMAISLNKAGLSLDIALLQPKENYRS